MTLSEAERSDILDAKIDSLSGGYVGYVDSASGNVSLRPTGPVITERGRTWAEVTYDSPVSDPGTIFWNIVFTVLTCGLYLPWWFYKTFKRPGVYTLSIDEHGDENWTQHDIPNGQRTLRYVLLAVLLAIAAFWVVGIIGYLAGVEVNPEDYRGY